MNEECSLAGPKTIIFAPGGPLLGGCLPVSRFPQANNVIYQLAETELLKFRTIQLLKFV